MTTYGYGNNKGKREVYTKEEVDKLLQGTLLYKNAAGTIESFTLQDSVKNFSYIYIFYIDQDGIKNSVRIDIEEDDEEIWVYLDSVQGGAEQAYISTMSMLIQGNSVTIRSNRRIIGWDNTEDGAYIKITKIIGY